VRQNGRWKALNLSFSGVPLDALAQSVDKIGYGGYSSTLQSAYAEISTDPTSYWPDRFGREIKAWTDHSNIRVNTLSLFSGAGGLDIGFEDAGFSIIQAVESNETFAQTLAKNSGPSRRFPNLQVACKDIRNYSPTDLSNIDFIIGSPPCQTFSAAARRAAGVLGTTDERGTLFKQYVRMLEIVKPKGFLFENVSGLTSAQNGVAWDNIQKAFADAGYQIFPRILSCADYGVPQFRERVIIVGLQEGEYLFPRPTHGPDSPGCQPFFTAGEAILDCTTNEVVHPFANGKYGHLLKEIPPGLNYSYFTEKMGHPNPVFAWRSKFSDFLYKADPDMPIRTIKARGGKFTGPFHWENRPFSISEIKRLQTLPDAYQLSGSHKDQMQQIGNSVPPQLARVLALSILEQLFGYKLPFDLPKLSHSERLGFQARKRLLTAFYANRAREHIRYLSPKRVPMPTSGKSYSASLTEKFGWVRGDGAVVHLFPEGDASSLERNLVVSVSRPDGSGTGPGFEISVEPSNGRWALQYRRVFLRGDALDPATFTAAWKAFESEIMSEGIKADLVQLCGYYTYTPDIKSKMDCEIPSREFRWQAVRKVVEGVGVRAIMESSKFAKEWEISRGTIPAAMEFLKALGYEVRNTNTNPRIPLDCYLIPYAFPTLTPVSIQRAKPLK